MVSVLEKVYGRSQNIVARTIDGEVILVPIRQNVGDLEAIYVLKGIGGFIWDRLDGSCSLAQIQEAIIDEFDIDQDVAETDLLEFVAQVEEIGGIEPHVPTANP